MASRSSSEQFDNEAVSDYGSNSEISQTSTSLYSQEPFETYQEKAKLLIESLFPSHLPSDITITWAAGGSYHRIVAVSLKSLTSTTEEHLILRIPRFSDKTDVVTEEALILKHLRALAPSIPIPEVLCYAGSENPLRKPYILMQRLEGESLHQVHQSMDQSQRLSMARTIARLIAQIHSIPVPSGLGPLCIKNDSVVVETLEGSSIDNSDKTLHDFLTRRFTERTEQAGEKYDYIREDFFRNLRSASESLLRGFTTPVSGTNVVRHCDFAARNILVRQSEITRDWEVSGVLDWDGCEVAPAEIAYLCPGWLWVSADDPKHKDTDGTYEMDWDPDEPVFNEECGAVKAAFVDEIEQLLPGFMDVVRRTRERSLKKLWELATHGISSDVDVALADKLIEEAATLNKEVIP
ncbi:kinase-like domain-containing protein [Flammula alnicola]|nr:kinase-like domain-containing protein [Flammula alnicola]